MDLGRRVAHVGWFVTGGEEGGKMDIEWGLLILDGDVAGRMPALAV
jgi:hypothetical protein